MQQEKEGLRLSIITPGEGQGAVGNGVDGESNKSIKFNVTFRKQRSTKSSKKGAKVLDNLNLPQFNEEINLNDISLNEIHLGQNTPDLFVANGNLVGEEYLYQGCPSGKFLSSNYENLESDSSVSRHQLGKIEHLEHRGARGNTVMHSSLKNESPVKQPSNSSKNLEAISTPKIMSVQQDIQPPDKSLKSSQDMEFDNKSQKSGLSSAKTLQTKQSRALTVQEIELEDADREIERLGEPMWLTNQFVNRPFCVILFGGSIIMAFSFFCIYFKTYWPSPVTSRDLLDYTHPNTISFDTRSAAEAEIQEKSSADGSIPLQSITNQELWLQVGIECVKDKYGQDCDNVLNPEGLKLLQEIDTIIEEDETWQKICLRQSTTNGSCAADSYIGGRIAKASPLLIFQKAFGADVSDLTQYAIDLVMFGLASSEEFYNYTIPFFSKDYSATNRKSRMVRILLMVAGPIEINGIRYRNMGDRWPEQEYEMAQWQIDLNERIMEMVAQKYEGYKVHSFGRAYAYRWFYSQLLFDVLWSGLSVLLVGLFITYHTKSIFVSMTSMSMILFSFPITLVIYRKIMMVTNVSSLHLMILFVVLGISADNIFVIWDAFRQSDTFPQLRGNYEKRMAYMFRRASSSLLATSSTTAFAFMSNGFSSLMPVSAFGWFAFIVVPVNYILIITYFPAFLIIYDVYVKKTEQKMLKKVIQLIKCQHIRSRDWSTLFKLLKTDKGNPQGQSMDQNQTQLELQGASNWNSSWTQSASQIDGGSSSRNPGDDTHMPQLNDRSYVAVENSIIMPSLHGDTPYDKGFKVQSLQPSNNRNMNSNNSLYYQKRSCQSEKVLKLNNVINDSLQMEGGGQIQDENITEESHNQHGTHFSIGVTQSQLNNNNNTYNEFLYNQRTREVYDYGLEDMLDLENQVKGGNQTRKSRKKSSRGIQSGTLMVPVDGAIYSKNQSRRNMISSKNNTKNQTGGLDSLLRTQKSKFSQRITKRSEKSNHINIPGLSKMSSANCPTSVSNMSSKSWKDEAIEQLGPIEIFFDTHFMTMITNCKCLFIILGLLFAGYAGIRSTEIQGLSKMEDFVKQDHYLYLAFDSLVFNFHDGDQGQSIVVDFLWGTDGLNKTGVDYFNASQIGTVFWDKEFDLSTESNQRHTLEFCDSLKQQKDLLYSSPDSSVKCWLYDFQTYLASLGLKYPLLMPDKYTGESNSVTGDNNLSTLEKQTQIELSQTKEQWSQQRYFNHYLLRYVRETKEGEEQLSQNIIGFIDEKLVYVKIQVKSSGGIYDPYATKNPVKLKWDVLLDEFNENADVGMNKGIQTAGLDWCMIITEIKLVETMKQGLIMSVGFALIALLLVTQNLFIAILASFTIGLIVVNVIGVIPYMGWQLGSSESVGVVVCVGFAVDYVVHLASHYVHSTYKHRHDRTQESLREMGISILSGSLTTILATAVLFICTIIMFYKFAIFVISTIVFAIYYSLFFFCAVCDLAGPNDQQGNFPYYFAIIKNRFMQAYTGQDLNQEQQVSVKNSSKQSKSSRNASGSQKDSQKRSQKDSRNSLQVSVRKSQSRASNVSRGSRSIPNDQRSVRVGSRRSSKSRKSNEMQGQFIQRYQTYQSKY